MRVSQGDGTIFGLFPPGGCRACKYRKPFDVSVDITGTLRRNKLRKAEAALIVMVEDCYDGTLQPLGKTTPFLRCRLIPKMLILPRLGINIGKLLKQSCGFLQPTRLSQRRRSEA